MNAIIRKLMADPRSLLTSESVLALGAFLAGYRAANEGSAKIFARLNDQFVGPSAADACTRAYLTMGDEKTAMGAVLDALERLQVTPAVDGQEEAHSIHPTFVDVVHDPIKAGRPGMVFAEPTVLWLADYAQGYIAGIASIDPVAAKTQEQQLQAFEAWLRDRYLRKSQARWYGLVRIYEGVDLYGLQGFVRLWISSLRRLRVMRDQASAAPAVPGRHSSR